MSGKFTLNSNVYKVARNTLLSLQNQKYKEIIEQTQHLRGIYKSDHDAKPDLSIYIVLVAGGYARIKLEEMPRVGSPGELVAELTQIGWLLCLRGMRQI